jgi:integrase
VRGARKVARLVFASAVGSGAIKVNPCDGVRVPRSDRHEMMFLSTSQIEALAEAISPPYGVLIRLAAYTGLRAGEIGALRVGRLDLLRRRIEVVESLAEELASYLADRSAGPTPSSSARPRVVPCGTGTSTTAVAIVRLEVTYGHLFPELDEALTEGLDAAYRAARGANRESVVARQWHGAPKEGDAVVDMQARNTV